MNPLNENLDGKVALVTGASGGIGRAICERLAAEGLRLVLVDIDASAAETLGASLDVDTFIAALDVSDPDAVSREYERITKEFAPVDVLVNCAGILSNNKLLATTPEEWHRVMAVNLDSTLYWSQAVVPSMKDNGFGRIINICSYAWKAGGLTAGAAGPSTTEDNSASAASGELTAGGEGTFTTEG